jgi:hypothetical protein
MLRLLIVILIVIGAWWLIKSASNHESYSGIGMGRTYGGRQSRCEDRCFSSQYYDACMNECLQQSSASWTGKPDDYEIDALEAPEPLDEERGQPMIRFAGPYRYDYPGH